MKPSWSLPPPTRVILRFHGVEEPLDVLLRHAPDVRLEPPVRGVQVAVAEDHLAVAASPGVGFHGQISDAAGGVQRDELVQGVELHAAVGQRHQLAPAPRGRVVLRGEEEARHSRGRLVDDGELAEAAGVPEPRDRGKLGVHLQPRGAAGEEQVRQAGLRGDGAVDQRRASLTRTPCAPPSIESQGAVGSQRTSGASTRRLLTTSRLAVTLLLELKAPVAAVLPTVSWVMSAVVAFSVLAAATVTSLSRLMPPSAKLASSAPSFLRTVTRAFWIWRSPAALCSWGVSTKVVAVRLLTVRSAVGATPLFSRAVTRPSMVCERVEGGHQGVAAVALGLAPAVRLDLADAAVAQDGPSGEGRPEEQAADEVGRELLLDEVEDAVALGHRRVPHKIPGVERREVAVTQVPPVRLRLGVGVAGG